MATPESAQPGVTKWIGPHRFDAEFPIPDECAQALRAMRWRALRRILLAWALAPVVLALSIAACEFWKRHSDAFLITGLCTSGILLIPAILLTNDGIFHIRGPARQALKAGTVHRYRLDPSLVNEMNAARALGRSVGTVPETIDLYPSVGRLARVGSEVVRWWRANAPLLNPAELAQATAVPPTTAGGHRALSADELEEMRQWVRVLGRPPWIVVWIAGVLGLAAMYGLAQLKFKPQLLLAWGVAAVWNLKILWAVHVKRSALSVQATLERDLMAGRVKILTRPALLEWARQFAPDAKGSLAESAELLEHCNRLWSADGVPAPWRMLRTPPLRRRS